MADPREDRRLYSLETDLPPWLEQRPDGLWYTNLPPEKAGPWHYVVDFGHSLAKLRKPLRLTEARHQPEGKIWYGENLQQRHISPAFRNITVLANEFDLTDHDVQFVYTANFVIGTRSALQKGIEHVGREAVVLAPDRGGRVLRIMLEALGVAPFQMPTYQASRNIFPTGEYTVALRLSEPLPNGRTVLHVDDCGAAGGTEYAGLAVWETLHGHRPERYAAVFGAGVRRAVERRASWLAHRGYDFIIASAAESNVMDDHYYLALTDQERRVLELPSSYGYRVNDMGMAMNFDTAARQQEIPLFFALAQHPEYDSLIFEATSSALADPGSLSTSAASMREGLSY